VPRNGAGRDTSAIPSLVKTREEIAQGIAAPDLFYEADLCASKSDAKRLIAQGGLYVHDRQVQSIDERISIYDMNEKGEIILRRGKKKHFIVTVK
jgi:tyrosyl-tRNA synthetase